MFCIDNSEFRSAYNNCVHHTGSQFWQGMNNPQSVKKGIDDLERNVLQIENI
jgi:hypothetical protein